MKIMVASDIHGSIGWAGRIIEKYKETGADKLLLLGDLLYHGPRNDLPSDYAPKEVIALLNEYKKDILAVRGNCDFGTELKNVLICVIEGVTIFMTHGHLSYVKYEYDLDTLTSQALEAGADIALFGHTHDQHISENRGVTLINPGSVGRGYYPAYAVLNIEGRRFTADLKSI